MNRIVKCAHCNGTGLMTWPAALCTDGTTLPASVTACVACGGKGRLRYVPDKRYRNRVRR